MNQILQLELGSILFWSHAGGDGQGGAIIQRFLPQSLYVKAHGAIVAQAQGDDATRLVQEYIERARYTLRFMASDTVARAQNIIWKNSNGEGVSGVVKAISDQFNEQLQKKRIQPNHSVSASTRNDGDRVKFTRRSLDVRICCR